MASYDEVGQGGIVNAGSFGLNVIWNPIASKSGVLGGGIAKPSKRVIALGSEKGSAGILGGGSLSSLRKIVLKTTPTGGILGGSTAKPSKIMLKTTPTGGAVAAASAKVGRLYVHRGSGGALGAGAAPYVRFYWPRPKGGILGGSTVKINWFLYSNGKNIRGGTLGGSTAKPRVYIFYFDKHWVLGGAKPGGKGYQTYNEPLVKPGVIEKPAATKGGGTGVVNNINPGEVQVISIRRGRGGAVSGGTVYPFRDAIHRPLDCGDGVNPGRDGRSGMCCRIEFPPKMAYTCSQKKMINGASIAAVTTCHFYKKISQLQTTRKWSTSGSSAHARPNSFRIS